VYAVRALNKEDARKAALRRFDAVYGDDFDFVSVTIGKAKEVPK